MARSYLPSKVSEIVGLWRKDLNKVTRHCTGFLWFAFDFCKNVLASSRIMGNRMTLLNLCAILSLS